ncbi:MAG: mechanosensitive ion channel family protein, partial [Epsilonproteobacteria bacterium]|nr:mechanosensitive ion channel family protein [Campylobacterota bacterium]
YLVSGLDFGEHYKEEESVRVVQVSTLPLFENTILILFSIAGMYQVFAIWNVDMTALLAGAGIGAMAVGMAAKDTLSDIIAGILILTDAPYRVGDVVYVRDNLKGRVSQIGLRNTRIVTRNNVEVIVPNTIMGTSQIVNESSSKEDGIRIHIDISVSNNEDVTQVKFYLLKAVEQSKEVNQSKKKKAVMIGFEMDMLQFRVQCWIDDPEKKGDAKAELMENIYLIFKEAQIDITLRRYQHVKVSHADPQEVYIKEFPQTSSKGELYIKEFPNTKQEQYIKEFPDTKQEVSVKEFPDTKQEVEISKVADSKQEVHIKEIPNLFGNGSVKKLTKVGKNPVTKKDNDEK